MTGVEYGARDRGLGTFPVWWGLPEGRSGSEERTSWLLRNIGTDQALERRGLDPVEVRTGKKNMSAHAALARVRRLQRGTTSRDVVGLDPGRPVKKLSAEEALALIAQIVADLKIASGQVP